MIVRASRFLLGYRKTAAGKAVQGDSSCSPHARNELTARETRHACMPILRPAKHTVECRRHVGGFLPRLSASCRGAGDRHASRNPLPRSILHGAGLLKKGHFQHLVRCPYALGDTHGLTVLSVRIKSSRAMSRLGLAHIGDGRRIFRPFRRQKELVRLTTLRAVLSYSKSPVSSQGSMSKRRTRRPGGAEPRSTGFRPPSSARIDGRAARFRCHPQR